CGSVIGTSYALRSRKRWPTHPKSMGSCATWQPRSARRDKRPRRGSMNLCSRCGGELGNDGLCEACLMAGGLDSGTESNTIIAVESLTPVDPQHALENDGFGPYRILRVLGQGGMGTVYLAEQSHPIRRQVALKVVKPAMDTQDILSRFNHERQAL